MMHIHTQNNMHLQAFMLHYRSSAHLFRVGHLAMKHDQVTFGHTQMNRVYLRVSTGQKKVLSLQYEYFSNTSGSRSKDKTVLQ
jgi:hypothetical protein